MYDEQPSRVLEISVYPVYLTVFSPEDVQRESPPVYGPFY